MSVAAIQCPYCAADVPDGVTVCPSCHEDLAALARLEYAPAIFYNQALSLAKVDDLERARDKLIVATNLDATFVPAHVLLAKILARQEAWPAANQAIVKALQLAPEDRQVRSLAARIDGLASEAQAAAEKREREAQLRQVEADRAEEMERQREVQRASGRQRELAGAFGIGVLAAAALGLVARSLFGQRDRPKN